VSTEAVDPAGEAAATGEAADTELLWLEQIDGERALALVRHESARTVTELARCPQFAPLRDAVRQVLDTADRLPLVEAHGSWLYNFWQDADHPRGLWRRCTWTAFRQTEPAWQTVLDLDALARAEGENWVWKGARVLPVTHDRALLLLSRGGADAVVVREFDLAEGRFVEAGFELPEAKTDVEWRDRESVFVASDFGPGSLTRSGYARTIRCWSRGTAPGESIVVFEGEVADVGVGVEVDLHGDECRVLLRRLIAYYRSQTWLLRNGTTVRLELPEDAEAGLAGDWLIVRLRSGWHCRGGEFPGGALLAVDAGEFLAGRGRFEALFLPDAHRSLRSWSATRDGLVLDVLDNVRSRPMHIRRDGARWREEPIVLPDAASAVVAPVDPHASDAVWITTQDFLAPPTLLLAAPGRAPELMKAMPSQFEAAGLTVTQHIAVSADGTRVPYFVTGPTASRGPAPTLLTGYGGFEIPLLPVYSGITGRAWLSRGGVHVVANIRGGGEFGPAWHQAALKHRRQCAYDDFIAVAEDLIRRGITTPRQLGIMGRSNGGLLVGVALTQRPELFGAVVCWVPLLDMRRYHRLLAGASWMAEYGDPDLPEDWAVLSRYSPYQQLRGDRRYPPVLFMTSTRDDRVHPGHARRMFARMRALGHDVRYHESGEGGHAGAASSADQSLVSALQYTFLWQRLGAS
jgi:prolyl oligopeptidase